MTVRPTETALGTNGQVLLSTYDTEVLADALWQQEVLLGTNPTDKVSALGLDAVPWTRRNLIHNGGFGTWLGSSSVTSAPGAISSPCVDGSWFIYAGTAALSAAGDGFEGNCVQLTAPAAGCQLIQRVYDLQPYRGLALTLRGRFNGGPGAMAIADDSGGSGSVGFDGTAGWVTAACPYVVGPAATTALVYIAPSAVGPLNCDNVTLAASAGGVGYMPPQPVMFWRESQRRTNIVAIHARFKAASSGQIEQYYHQWRDPLRAVPTSYSLNQGTNRNINPNPANTGIVSIDDKGVTWQMQAIVAGDTYVLGGSIAYQVTL